MKRKGFIHIIEIIIISIVMFFILVQFSLIPVIETDWENTKLYLIGNDLVHTLNKDGIDWTNANNVNATIYNLQQNGLLSANFVYDIKIKDETGTVTNVIFSEINDPVIVSYHQVFNNAGNIEFREVIFTVGYLF